MTDESKNYLFKKGDKLGQYLIVSPLGRGGMGDVYLAHEPALERKVAIKLISERGMEDKEFLARFLAEGKSLARFQHPNIVSIHAVGEYQGRPYLVMEYVSGNSLNWCMEHGTIAFADFLPLFSQMLHGVAEAHRHAVIHRDLKPGNIIITEDKQVKIIDFGIAKDFAATDTLETSVGVLVGTLNYLAPELIRGQLPSIQSDIYSLGAILYEMFIGSPPFFGENRLAILEKIKTEPITIPDTLKDLIADDLQSLILKMLHKDRNQRFESIDQLIKLVDKFEIISIPEEFKWTRSRTLKIDNEEEIKSLLNRAGFLSREISTIVSIANSLHSEPSIPVEDRTEILKPQQAVTITPAELNQAIERFRSLKTQRAFQATSGSFKSIPSDGKGKPAKPINVAWQNWGLSFIAVLGIIVASQVYRNIGVQKTDLASKSQLKFNPYGKVFIGDGVRVEVVTLEELNEIGLPYVLIRFSGSPAYSEGLDKKIGKYSPSPAGLAGFDYTIFEQGKGHTRFLTRKYPSNPNYAEAFLNGKENKVAEDPKESSALSTSEIVNEFVLQ